MARNLTLRLDADGAKALTRAGNHLEPREATAAKTIRRCVELLPDLMVENGRLLDRVAEAEREVARLKGVLGNVHQYLGSVREAESEGRLARDRLMAFHRDFDSLLDGGGAP